MWSYQGVRFAFYGRTSTAEFQDPVTSRAWQREVPAALVAGHGTIMAEFFDVGCSRRVSWERRPEAAALLEQAQGVDCFFDAVVVGEFERAFTDRQFEQVARLLSRHGIRVWLPEAGDPVDLNTPAHRVFDAGAGRAVAARGGAAPSSDDGGDDRTDGRAGPLHGWPPTVRVSAGRRGTPSEARARGVGTALSAGRHRTCGGCSPRASPGAAGPASRAS
jgi:hypothetical protein